MVPEEPDELAELERRREELYRQLGQVGDFRRGSLHEVRRKCGKPNCACAAPDHPGHGPQYNLTRTVEGRTRARHLRPGPELEKIRREVGQYFATTLIRGGTDLVTVADMLGHARLDTVRTYTPPHRRRGRRRLPARTRCAARTPRGRPCWCWCSSAVSSGRPGPGGRRLPGRGGCAPARVRAGGGGDAGLPPGPWPGHGIGRTGHRGRVAPSMPVRAVRRE